MQEEEAREQSRREEEEAGPEIEITVTETEPAKKQEEEVSKVETDQEPEKPLELVFPPMPKNLWKPPQEVPTERLGSGVNKKVTAVSHYSIKTLF